jgi:proteasome accessory factor A
LRKPVDVEFDALESFRQLVDRLLERVPLAPSHHNPFRFFLANGSSVSLEPAGDADLRSALFEIATPECTSPRDLVLYSLSNEKLLEEAFAEDHDPSQWSFIKANMDSQGHTLGQHESYDMQIAQWKGMLIWWLGLLILLPVVLLYRALAISWIATVSGVAHARSRMLRDSGQKPSLWGIRITASGLRILHGPIVIAFLGLIRLVALRRQRKELTSFLATRCILDGAGHVDEDGRFWISQRASMINRVIGFGSYGDSRPIFRCDALLRDLIAGPFWSLTRYRRLFRWRQRIEIAIGDSGMCQWSQHLRFGTTSLILDLVESGDARGAPRLSNPVDAINRLARDWTLVRTVPDRHKLEHSALDLQRWYAKRLKRYLESRRDVPPEAWEIAENWQSTLNQLASKPTQHQIIPRTLVGRLDWISKLWLILQLDPATPWPVRKKIDIRYHELSSSGYYRKLAELVQIAPLVGEEAISKATRTPPSHPPAQRRGNLIREFAGSDADLHVDWRSATFSVDGRRFHASF